MDKMDKSLKIGRFCSVNIHDLVGGLEHFSFFHILGIIIPIDFHIFQWGGSTTNQEDSAKEALEQRSEELASVTAEKLRLKEEGEESLAVKAQRVTGKRETWLKLLFHWDSTDPKVTTPVDDCHLIHPNLSIHINP